MQMLYGYDVVADLAPRTAYDEVVTRPRRRRRDRHRPAPDRRRARPGLRVGRALPRQRHHRRRGRLPAQPRSGSEPVRAAPGAAPRTSTPSGEITVAAYDRVHRSGPTTPTSPGCATPRAATARPSCGSRRGRRRGRSARVTDLPAGLAVARDGRRPDEGEFRMLAVAPAARRRGVGRGAGRGSSWTASASSGATAVVLSQPRRRWPRAHRLYERLGFRRAPERDWAPDARRRPDRLPTRLELHAWTPP